jgi:hypothetical protein
MLSRPNIKSCAVQWAQQLAAAKPPDRERTIGVTALVLNAVERAVDVGHQNVPTMNPMGDEGARSQLRGTENGDKPAIDVICKRHGVQSPY